MDYKDTHFPQYRKLVNEKSFYRIVDGRHFDELQLIGSKAVLHELYAEQYPEMLRIKDMLELAEGYLTSSQSEFEVLLKSVE
ncbi:MAG: hypothetical protein ACI865_001501 [Flavobacteriaceae bacterium]|jgi:hypothetical protein